MKRKLLKFNDEWSENEQDNDDDDGEDRVDDGIATEIGLERHPPPPKKARLSAEEEKSLGVCANDIVPSPRALPFQRSIIKTEPREDQQNAESNNEFSKTSGHHQHQGNLSKISNEVEVNSTANGTQNAADCECKVEVPSSTAIASSRPPTVSPPAMAEVSTTSYPDDHPVPIPVSRCSRCACAKSLCIELPLELLVYFKRAAGNGAFQSLLESVPNISVQIDDTERFLVVKSFSSAAIEKVRMLADAFVENSRQRQQMLRKREDSSKWSLANFESNMFDANFLVEIEVPLAYIGLAFGRNRSNLAAARGLNGIREITVDESQKAQGICKFKIYANTAEAAEHARKMLEFTDRRVSVQANMVGRLIGKHSRIVRDIVNKSTVVRIFVDNNKDNEDDKIRHFVLIGTPDTIANAEMMLHFHLRHIRERDDFDEEREEIERERILENSSMSDVSSSACRNYDNSEFDHWTSAMASSTESSATLAMPSSSGIRANNNNRPPRPISSRSYRHRHNYYGTTAGGWGNDFSTGMAPLTHGHSYYQLPLSGTTGKFGGCAESVETVDSKHRTGSKYFGRRNSSHNYY